MIRVGFILNLSDTWLGGINYFRNLFLAITEMKDTKIKPVVFTGTKISGDLVKEFPNIEWVKSPLFDRYSFAWTIRKIDEHVLRSNICLNRLFKRHNIDVLSHTPEAFSNLKIPMLGWIPDFQHKYLTNFFSEKDIINRNKLFKKLCDRCQGILVSSYDAKKDLEEFDFGAAGKAHILRFVVQPTICDVKVSIEDLEETYDFQGNYFYIPNQFWVHKNHKVVLEALKILKMNGHNLCVISTGSISDYRYPEHFSEISSFIKENDLSLNFIVLGKIPYQHVVTLADHCLSLINPSLFEGWSTTVEEAKSLGKRIILSDIPVHREQSPPGGLYFNPQNPESLAEILLDVWNSKNDDTLLKEQAKLFLKQRKVVFAKEYENIILKALSNKGI